MPSTITITITDEGRTDLDLDVKNGPDLMAGFVGLIRAIAQLSNQEMNSGQTPKDIAEEAVAFFAHEENEEAKEKAFKEGEEREDLYGV